ncbi:Neurotrypsin [Mizuhopecten yessoensis]|uniref:Neurotrypsin n=1 Tax=Mizuhopecten yessoensis TaxID=6573 RepID=A0A210QYJ2_MIZYE|nr:Neurotrypsin [Mizuhopecten yessoensis]
MFFSLNADNRLMVHDMTNGHVGSICGLMWNDTEAAVMCRHLGLPGPGSATILQRSQNFSRGLFAINCTGNELDAFDCDLATSDISNGMCGNLGDAALNCGTRGKSVRLEAYMNGSYDCH